MDEARFHGEARFDRDGPLHGVVVLDVTTAWSGPMATCVLADLGADVVRVEMPGNRDGQIPPDIPGTGLSWFRETVNRNKRSVAADLRTDEGRDAFLYLVRRADVVVENFRPGTMDVWRVGYDDCRAVKDDIVFVSISGWGQYGPACDRPGYDPAAQAASGWMALNGEPDGGPVKAPTFLADDLAGLHAALGALAALRHRDACGEGQHVDVSLLDCLLFQADGLPTLAACGLPVRRGGNELEVVAPANVYACADGPVYVTVALDRHWRALAGAMGRPELARAPGFATNGERCANRQAVNAVVADWCAARTRAEVIARLEEAGITVAAVRTLHEAVVDPHVQARRMLVPTVLSNGTVAPLVAPPVKFSRTPTSIRRPAPVPGAHTDELLGAAAVSAAATDGDTRGD
ncbi:MAG: CoA transferase [Actinobacteria bacterium]|nr:CoA transferase [Actinomycetota bacterium]